MSGEATGKPTAASGKPARGASASTPPAPPAPSVSSPPPSVPPKKAAGTPSPTSAAGATKVSGSGGSQGAKATGAQAEAAKTAPSTRPGGTPAAKGPSPIGTVTAATPTSTAPSVSGAPASQGSSTAPARPSVTQAEPSTGTTQASPAVKKAVPGPRRVRLAVARIDPWSAMKLSFLLSIALGIMMIVATIVFWMVLDGMYVFTEVDRLVQEVLGDAADVNVLQYVEFKRVVSLATIIAIVDMVLLTALATIGAFLYNVVASLVGGVHLTLIDE